NAVPDEALDIVDPVLSLEEEEISRGRSRIPSFMRRQKKVGALISLLEIGVACSMYDSEQTFDAPAIPIVRDGHRVEHLKKYFSPLNSLVAAQWVSCGLSHGTWVRRPVCRNPVSPEHTVKSLCQL
ncbi:hypothetical protein HAX54_041076, partial [Datura stramonium]|nr:hypothetical protein [Datura stramonium]